MTTENNAAPSGLTDGQRAVLDAIRGEYLTDPTEAHGDAVYQRAVADCESAVLRLFAATSNAAPDELKCAGALMANTMFNLAQRPGTTIDAHLCEQMDQMRRQWDAAVRLLAAPKPASSGLTLETIQRIAETVRDEYGNRTWGQGYRQDEQGRYTIPKLPAVFDDFARALLAAAPKAAEQAPVPDDEQLIAFDVLLDAYQDAQINGTTKDRADARRALRAAYRAAVTSPTPAAEQAPVADAARAEPVAELVKCSNVAGREWFDIKVRDRSLPHGTLLYTTRQPARASEAGEAVAWYRPDCGLMWLSGDEYPNGVHLYAGPTPAQQAVTLTDDARDGARYRAFFSAGLPITFLGVDYCDKSSLDAAIDAALQSHSEGEAS
jgi:hypothetical protein